MSLIDGPDVAGILDALGRHDAAETLRWSETAHPHADCETEIAGLTDDLAETIREMECAQEDLGKAKADLERAEPVLAAARAYERAWTAYASLGSGPPDQLILAKAHAHQALLNAVRTNNETTKDSVK